MVEEDLLAAIAADVDAPEPRLVYADWLMQQGDPRGELAIVEHELARKPDDNLLRSRRSDLWHELKTTLHPGEHRNGVLVDSYLGFVDHFAATRSAIGYFEEQPAVLDHPALRFVRTFRLGPSSDRGWKFVAGWRHRTHVRHFAHGGPQKRLPKEVFANLAQFPQLRELTLQAPVTPELARMPAEIRALRLEIAESVVDSLAPIFERPLHTLAVRATAFEPRALAPLLAGDALADVRRLELHGVAPIAVIEGLVASERIASIDTLALRFDQLGPADSVRLLALRSTLAHVKLEIALIRHEGPYLEGYARYALAGVLAQLGRYDEALAIYGDPNWLTQQQRDAFARILAQTNDRARWQRAIDRLAIVGRIGDRASMVRAIVAALPRERWLVEHRVRALIEDKQYDVARGDLDGLPPVDTTRLLRALADRGANLRSPMFETRSATYLALGWLVHDVFHRVVPSAIEPAEILAQVRARAAMPLDDDPDDLIDVATIAAVAAAHASDRILARVRVEALALRCAVGARALHHDLLAVADACAQRVSYLESGLLYAIPRAVCADDAPTALARVAAAHVPYDRGVLRSLDDIWRHLRNGRKQDDHVELALAANTVIRIEWLPLIRQIRVACEVVPMGFPEERRAALAEAICNANCELSHPVLHLARAAFAMARIYLDADSVLPAAVLDANVALVEGAALRFGPTLRAIAAGEDARIPGPDERVRELAQHYAATLTED